MSVLKIKLAYGKFTGHSGFNVLEFTQNSISNKRWSCSFTQDASIICEYHNIYPDGVRCMEIFINPFGEVTKTLILYGHYSDKTTIKRIKLLRDKEMLLPSGTKYSIGTLIFTQGKLGLRNVAFEDATIPK